MSIINNVDLYSKLVATARVRKRLKEELKEAIRSKDEERKIEIYAHLRRVWHPGLIKGKNIDIKV